MTTFLVVGALLVGLAVGGFLVDWLFRPARKSDG